MSLTQQQRAQQQRRAQQPGAGNRPVTPSLLEAQSAPRDAVTRAKVRLAPNRLNSGPALRPPRHGQFESTTAAAAGTLTVPPPLLIQRRCSWHDEPSAHMAVRCANGGTVVTDPGTTAISRRRSMRSIRPRSPPGGCPVGDSHEVEALAD